MVLQRVKNDTTEAIEYSNTYSVFLPSESPQGAQFEPAVADGLRVTHPLFTDMAYNIFPPQDQTLQTTALGWSITEVNIKLLRPKMRSNLKPLFKIPVDWSFWVDWSREMFVNSQEGDGSDQIGIQVPFIPVFPGNLITHSVPFLRKIV